MATAKGRQRSIFTARTDAVEPSSKKKESSFQTLSITLQSIDTALLLLYSPEDPVLISVFKGLGEFVRKQDENIIELKNHNLLKVLMDKRLFVESENVLVRRFALYLLSLHIESIKSLEEFTSKQLLELITMCLESYIKEMDDFCLEYLSVAINKLMDDPQVVKYSLGQDEFLEKYFLVMTKLPNPDAMWNSFETLHKMLQILELDRMKTFTRRQLFPADRIICELTCEYAEIRTATLKVIKDMIVDLGDDTVFADRSRCIFTLRQLTELFCKHATDEHGSEAVDVLAIAMRTEKMTDLFFEQNLFDKLLQNLALNAYSYPLALKCRVLAIFAENSKFVRYLQHLCQAGLIDNFIECVLEAEQDGPPLHVLLGLNRIMQLPQAANKIVDTTQYPIIPKLLSVMCNLHSNIEIREQAAELVGNMLTAGFPQISNQLIILNVADLFAKILGTPMTDLSVDFILSILNIIEQLAQNDEYRAYIGNTWMLIGNMGLLLRNSFATATLVSHLFRCLCTLVDEKSVRRNILKHYICESITKGLKSLSNVVRASVTNFIIQTTRFPEMLEKYIHNQVLEVLILYQKHSLCVPTWNPAIDSILSKNPSLKFCIRNHLSFTDITAGHDFRVSKKKFDDFRIFLRIINENVSPMSPILVVNFDRPENECMIEVPLECFLPEERATMTAGWRYCCKPGDGRLPELLKELNAELERNGLNQKQIKTRRCIDFENVARRAKLIANLVACALGENLKSLDINSIEECCSHTVKNHMRDLALVLHCNFIPIGMMRSGCHFARAVLFKALADQIGLPCTLQRSANPRLLFNEVPLPVKNERDIQCDRNTMEFLPWRMLRPTHVVDLLFNVGDLYPIQSREALQYLQLF